MCATPEGFEQDTALSRRLGYRGRKLIHPAQIEPCNRLYAPSEAELDYYARVLEAFDKALAQGSASTTVDGKMIDVAMANAARRVLDAGGVEEGGIEPDHFFAAPNGAVSCSNSSMTTPGSDSSVRPTVIS